MLKTRNDLRNETVASSTIGFQGGRVAIFKFLAWSERDD